MKLVIICLLLMLPAISSADTYVEGYYRKNGTYVQPHYRSDRNGTSADNWSTRGNTNPYTGQVGTRSYSDSQTFGSSYGSSIGLIESPRRRSSIGSIYDN